MDERQIIAMLDQAVRESAVESITRPLERTAYGFGYAAGLIGGLEMAKDTVLKSFRDEEERERRL